MKVAATEVCIPHTVEATATLIWKLLLLEDQLYHFRVRIYIVAFI